MTREKKKTAYAHLGAIKFPVSAQMKHSIAFTFYCLVIRSDEELKLKTSTLETIYGGQFTLSTQLITVRYHVIPHRRSTIALFLRN